MQIGRKEIKDLIKADRKLHKKKLRILIAVTIFILIISLCFKTVKVGLMSPVEVITSYKTWIQINIGKWFETPVYLQRNQIIAEIPAYYDAISRLKITIITFVCGVLLALSGTLFQSVFRNPIAAPTMLGVNAGVSTGILFLVVQYGAAALTMPLEKYVYCYVGAVLMLTLVMGAGKLSSGKGKFSVFDLLIAGSILSQIVGALRSYYTFSMENDQALILTEVTNALVVNTENISFIFLGTVLIISVIPIYLMRFSMNSICFDNDEARSFGVNTGVMKIIALMLGTIMVTAAMIHCGTVGMISLIAPFISRAIFGADFRNNFLGNMLIGGTMLVLCRDIVSLIHFGNNGLPIGTVVEFVAVPIFVVILVTQRRVWE